MSAEPNQQLEDEFNAILHHLDELVQEFENLPLPDVRDKALDMLQTIDAVHRESLRRLIAFIHEQGHADLILRAAHDPVVRTLLLLYDFLPTEESDQVESALSTIRPYVHSHGGEVELLSVADGVVHLRLSGACYGCAGSTMTLRHGIEQALRENYPGFKRIEVHDAAPAPTHAAPGFIPLDHLNAARRPVFRSIARLQEIEIGKYKVFDVDNLHVLVANVNGEIYAVRNNCPGSAAPLNLGPFTPPVIVCPWHNEAWDIRTGKRSDGQAGANLEIIPVAIIDDTIQLAVNTIRQDQLQGAA